MESKRYKYIYGPVYSWRIGISLGIDPLAGKEKVCTFDCNYCQLGDTKVFSSERKIYVSAEDIIKEIQSLPDVHIDYLTFSGRGEPTLAKNLGEIICCLKRIRKEKIAVITNSSLLGREDVQKDLSSVDFVLVKLDACSESTFINVDRPIPGMNFDAFINGIKSFKKVYKGKLAIQVMLVKQNKEYVKDIAEHVRTIEPDEIQINTPTRPGKEKPLTKDDMDSLKKYFVFKDIPVLSVYDKETKIVEAFDDEETILRHGQYKQGDTKDKE